VIKALEETGQSLPQDYARKPYLYPHLAHILQAFFQLDSDRNFRDVTKKAKVDGKDANKTIKQPMPISFNSIARYANIYGYDEELDDLDEFMFFIRKLDNAYMEFESDKVNPDVKR